MQAMVVAPASREGAESKGRRLLCEGRLIVTLARRGRVEATCRGNGAVHQLGFNGDWWCTCEARGTCSHLVALRLITAPDL